MSEHSKALGLCVRRNRKQLKLTQAQLAERIGVTEQTIRKIEHLNSNPQLDVLIPLIRALHIDPREIFYPEVECPDTTKQQLDMLLATCKSEHIEALTPIIKSVLDVLGSNLLTSLK